VSAEDKDSDRFNRFDYKLKSSSAANDSFGVDPETGEITVRASLDREARSLHQFSVVAFDRREPTMSSTAVVSVQVLSALLTFDLLTFTSPRGHQVIGNNNNNNKTTTYIAP